jgi:uncharacterized OB-fold protein
MVCKKCKKNDTFEFDIVPLPKKGKLLTFTEVYALPPAYEMEKLPIGIVELENGLKMTGQLRIPNPKMGMKVKGEVEVVRDEEYDQFYGMVFSKA